MGPQSTLVLLNGQRRAGGLSGRAVDVSSIPLSAIERIDISTGGASAIYGSDAVAGVVNLVLRRAFNGAESQLYYGVAAHGLERLQLSQTFGKEADRGGFIVALDYAKDKPLDIVKTDLNVSPTYDGSTINRQFYVTPDDHKYSIYVGGHYQLSGNVDVFGDALYSHKKDNHIANYTLVGCCNVDGTILNTNEQLSGSAGLEPEDRRQ